jgi:hypothetical protein
MPIPLGRDRRLWPVTVSIGVAIARVGMAGPEQLIEHADRRLYAAKDAGRDRVRGATPGTVGAADPSGPAGTADILPPAPADILPPAPADILPAAPADMVLPAGAADILPPVPADMLLPAGTADILPPVSAVGQPARAGITARSSRSSDRESYAASGT